MNELMEKLAAIEHDRWGDWQGYMFGRCKPLLNAGGVDTGDLIIDKEDAERWQRQIDTHYAELSEPEKQSDRDQVDRYWDLIPHWVLVSERLPEDHHPGYLVRGLDDIPHKAFWDYDHWIFNGARFEWNAFVDWMEIPQ